MGDDEVFAVADAFVRASEAGDVDRLRALLAPDAVVWHNVDGRDRPVDDYLGTVPWIAANLGDMRHDDVRRSRTDSGFVQQHVLRATTPGGAELAVPACIVVAVREGRITRIDEYLDPTPFSVLVGEHERGG